MRTKAAQYQAQLGERKEQMFIYSLFLPSLCVYMGEQRNVSFLLEGKGGETERGRESQKEVDKHTIR